MQCEEWADANSELFKEAHDETVHKNSYNSNFAGKNPALLGEIKKAPAVVPGSIEIKASLPRLRQQGGSKGRKRFYFILIFFHMKSPYQEILYQFCRLLRKH